MKSSGIAHVLHAVAGAVPRFAVAHAAAPRAPWDDRARPAADGAPAYVLRPPVAVALAFASILAIGYFRYATTLELRLAVLYGIPVALATWAVGRPGGLLSALLAATTWMLAFTLRDAPVDALLLGNGALLVGTLLLFTELVSRVRQALVRSDERLLRVLDGLADALYVTDDAGTVLYANRRLLALVGKGNLPRSARDFAARLSPIRGRTDASSGDSGAKCTEVRDRANGRTYRLQTSVIPWVDLRRVELHVLSDITDQKIEQGLRDEQRAAVRHTARLTDMGETASLLAHELNQPLVALVGYHSACLRLLEAEPLDRGALAVALEKSRAQAVRAGDIVHRMRELAQRRAPRVAPADINAIVREQLANAADDFARAGVHVELALAPAVPTVEADAVLVAQVLRNLADNAVDAMWECPRGARQLTIGTDVQPAGGVRVTVADRGHGVPAEVADKMYRPFFTTRNNGLGLGLAICRSIAEAHGGRLWHEPRTGGGTAFHFTLP